MSNRDRTLADVEQAVAENADLLGELIDAVRANTAAINKWGSDLESRLASIEYWTANPAE